MKKPIKITLFVLIFIAVAAGSVFYMMMPTPVRMTEIYPRLAELSFTEQGIVTAENQVLVFPISQGELNGIYVSEGQNIRAGDAILSVDSTGLHLRMNQVLSGIVALEAQIANLGVEQNRVNQELRSTRNALQGELQAINAQAADIQRNIVNQNEVVAEQVRIQNVLIEQNENDVISARENYERIRNLYGSGVATRTELNNASSNLTRANTVLEASRHELSIISSGGVEDNAEYFAGVRASINARISGINQQLGQDFTAQTAAQINAMIEIERANVAQLEREIANSTIHAPIDGIITTLHAQSTNVVNAAQPIAEITVPGGMYIDVYVSTQDIGTVQVGDTVGLTLRQRVDDIEFEGRVIEISNSAVVRFSALGVEERKVAVTIRPQLPTNLTIGIGYAIDATFYVFREENQVLVPRTAVFRDNGQYMVWRVQGYEGEVEAVPVIRGIELRTDTVIESGLSVGDFVVNDANNPDLRNGVRVVHER